MKKNHRKKKNSAMTHDKNHTGWGLFLVAPTIIGLLVLNIIPFFQTIYLSFTDARGFQEPSFIRFDNYIKLFSDPEFWKSFANTFQYALFQVPLTLIISLLMAVFLHQKVKGVSVFRTLYFLPMVASGVAISMVWKYFFNSEYGLLNNLLKTIGLPGDTRWLTNPNVVLWTVILVGVWQSLSSNIIILLSGLQEIPDEYYESSSIDGAGKIRQFFTITIPLLSPQIFFVLITTVIGAMQVFDTIFVMIESSSPAITDVQSISYMYYNESFVLNNRGYGATIAVVLLIIILIFTVIQLRGQKKWVNYS